MGASIAVVTAVYNGARTLQRCIDSVAGQSYTQVEHIIIDGGSTDGTLDLLKKNSSKLAYWVSEPDRGIYDAWNKGIEHSNGEWLVFLGCDDFLWNEDSLTKMAPALADSGAGHRLIYGLTNVVDDRGEVLYPIGEPWERAKNTSDYMLCYPNPSAFYHRSLFGDYGVFDSSYRYAGDYEFSLRFIEKESPLFVEDAVVAGFTTGGVSNSDRTVITHLREAITARRANGCAGMPTGLYGAMARVYVKMACRILLPSRCFESLIRRRNNSRYRGRSVTEPPGAWR